MNEVSDDDYFAQLVEGFYGVIARVGGAEGMDELSGDFSGAAMDSRPSEITRALNWVTAMVNAQDPDLALPSRRREFSEQWRKMLLAHMKIMDGQLAKLGAGDA